MTSGVSRPRVPAAWAVPRLLGVLGAAVVAGLAAALSPSDPARALVGADGGPAGWVAWALGTAAVVGLLLAARAGRLVRGLVALPDQPERDIRPPVRAGRAGVDLAVVVLAVGGTAWLAAAGALPAWPGAVFGAVAIGLLPGALVLRHAAAACGWRAPDGSDLTWRDLWWVGVRAKPVPIDGRVKGVRRWDESYVPGVRARSVPWPPSALSA